MKNAKRIIAIALLLAVLASPSINVARADSQPSWDDNKNTFTAGSLKAVFESNQPRVKFTLTTDTGNTEYIIRFKRVLEFNNTNGNGLFTWPEKTALAELENAIYTVASYPIKNNAGSIIGLGVNFTTTITQIDGKSGNQNVPVILVAKAYNTTQTITTNGKTITVEQAEIKIDFIISNWPFDSTQKAPRLALQVNLHSEKDDFETEESDQVREIHATTPEPTNVAEHEFHERSDPEQEVRFAGTIGTTGMIGFFRFVNTATINHSTTVPVLASYKGEQESEGGSMESEFAVFLSYPQFTGTLEHDPSFGFTSGIALIWYVLGGTAIVALGVVVLLRRAKPHIQTASL